MGNCFTITDDVISSKRKKQSECDEMAKYGNIFENHYSRDPNVLYQYIKNEIKTMQISSREIKKLGKYLKKDYKHKKRMKNITNGIGNGDLLLSKKYQDKFFKKIQKIENIEKSILWHDIKIHYDLLILLLSTNTNLYYYIAYYIEQEIIFNKESNYNKNEKDSLDILYKVTFRNVHDTLVNNITTKKEIASNIYYHIERLMIINPDKYNPLFSLFAVYVEINQIII